MCIFCAAVPMSAAFGAAISGKQHQRAELAQTTDSAVIEHDVPIGKITVAVTGSLVACSVVYHLLIASHTGISL